MAPGTGADADACTSQVCFLRASTYTLMTSFLNILGRVPNAVMRAPLPPRLPLAVAACFSHLRSLLQLIP